MSKMKYNDRYEVKAPKIFLNGANFKVGSLMAASGIFATTAETADVAIDGAAITDIYFVAGEFTLGVDQQDVLQWEATADGLTVHRLADGESALNFSWLRVVTV